MCGAVGATHGWSLMLPLIGVSGGGGGGAGDNFAGAGGGGGGGAILIAASGKVEVSANGVIYANGGTGGGSDGAAGGGAGRGGGIRIVATTITGNGTIQATGGPGGPVSVYYGGNGGAGRIRLEADNMQRTANTNPAYTTIASGTSPGPVFVSGSPSLLISKVAGVDAPALPTSSDDIRLPASTAKPVAVVFTTRCSGRQHRDPDGDAGERRRDLGVSPALASTGPVTATASVNMNFPSGPSVLSASTTYTVTASLGDALSRFAQGERVEKVTLVARPGAASTAVLHTVSGKTYEIAAALLPSGS